MASVKSSTGRPGSWPAARPRSSSRLKPDATAAATSRKSRGKPREAIATTFGRVARTTWPAAVRVDVTDSATRAGAPASRVKRSTSSVGRSSVPCATMALPPASANPSPAAWRAIRAHRRAAGREASAWARHIHAGATIPQLDVLLLPRRADHSGQVQPGPRVQQLVAVEPALEVDGLGPGRTPAREASEGRRRPRPDVRTPPLCRHVRPNRCCSRPDHPRSRWPEPISSTGEGQRGGAAGGAASLARASRPG